MSNPATDELFVTAVFATAHSLVNDDQLGAQYKQRIAKVAGQISAGNPHLIGDDLDWMVDRLYDNRKTCGLNRMLSPYGVQVGSHKSAIREVVRHFAADLARPLEQGSRPMLAAVS